MDHSYEHGLLTKEELEIDRVLGYLTADEIIERIENNYKFLCDADFIKKRLDEISEELNNRLAELGEVSGEEAQKLFYEALGFPCRKDLESFSPEKHSL